MFNKKAASFGIVLLVIGLIITATAAVFYFSGEKKDQVYSGTVTPIKIPVNYAVPAEYNLEFTIKPCKEIDESFNCKLSSSFNRGDKIYFLMNIKNLNVVALDNNHYYDLILEKQFKNTDENMTIMDFSESSENIRKEVPASDLINIQVVKELITLKDDRLGNYEYTVKIKDNISNEEDSRTVKFLLK